MKTSLNIENELFESAKKEAAATGKSLSEVLSLWARRGRDDLRKHNRKRRQFKTVSLGTPLIDLTKRKDWMQELEDNLNS